MMNDEFLAHSLFGRVAIPVGKPTYRYGKLTIMPFVGICSITELHLNYTELMMMMMKMMMMMMMMMMI